MEAAALGIQILVSTAAILFFQPSPQLAAVVVGGATLSQEPQDNPVVLEEEVQTAVPLVVLVQRDKVLRVLVVTLKLIEARVVVVLVALVSLIVRLLRAILLVVLAVKVFIQI